MCHLHYTLKDKTPGVTDAPSGESVRALLAEHDMDGSGTLSLEEFQTLAATWYKRDAIVFAEKLLLSSFIGMVALPGAAELLHGQVPIMRRVPKMVFKVIFGIGKVICSGFRAFEVMCMLTDLIDVLPAYSFQDYCDKHSITRLIKKVREPVYTLKS